MRSTKRKMLLPALLAVLALSAAAASAAQAATAEGPFYKITGSRLLEGKTQEITGKSYERFEMHIPALGIDVDCGKTKFAKGARLLGSTGANSAAAEGTLEFFECHLESGNGEGNCQVREDKFTTSEPVKLEPAYVSENRSGDIATLIKGAKKEKFAVISFQGAGCQYPEMNLSGSTAALVGKAGSRGAPVEVGHEPAEAKTSEISWPQNNISTVWVEEKGSLVKKRVELDSIGSALDLAGGMEFELSTAANWGVFT